jgi:hypothetical protein
MGIEEEIKKLKEAETGEVERTIRTVEDFVSEGKEILRKREDIFGEYEALIRQKLPVAIDNVFLLKDYLKEINFDYYFSGWSREWEGYDIKPRKSKKNSELLLKGKDFVIRFLFEKDGGEPVREISLYTDYYSRFFNVISFGKKWRRYECHIKSESSSEFTEKLIPYLIKEVIEEEKDLQGMVYHIMELPNQIREYYAGIKENRSKKQERIEETLVKLQKVQVSDF